MNNYEQQTTNYDELRTTVICLLSSTFVENALQIGSFMQNKANLLNAQMNANKVITRDYENETLGKRGKNKPNTNPIKPNQTQLKPIKCQNKPNTNPIKPNLLNTQMNVNKVLTKDYENERLHRHGKNKPKTNPIKARLFGLSSPAVHKENDFLVLFWRESFF